MAKYASSISDSVSSDQDELVKKDDWWTEECQDATKALKKALHKLKHNKTSKSLRHNYKKLKIHRRRVLRSAFEKWYDCMDILHS